MDVILDEVFEAAEHLFVVLCQLRRICFDFFGRRLRLALQDLVVAYVEADQRFVLLDYRKEAQPALRTELCPAEVQILQILRLLEVHHHVFERALSLISVDESKGL